MFNNGNYIMIITTAKHVELTLALILYLIKTSMLYTSNFFYITKSFNIRNLDGAVYEKKRAILMLVLAFTRPIVHNYNYKYYVQGWSSVISLCTFPILHRYFNVSHAES